MVKTVVVNNNYAIPVSMIVRTIMNKTQSKIVYIGYFLLQSEVEEAGSIIIAS